MPAPRPRQKTGRKADQQPGRTTGREAEGIDIDVGGGPIGERIEDAADDGLARLAEVLAGLDDPTGYEVVVSEVTTTGRAIAGKYAASEFDPADVAIELGGGNYIAQVRDATTKKYKTQKTFRVRDDLAGTRKKPAAAEASPASGSRDPMGALLLPMVLKSMDTQATIMAALIQSRGQPTTAGLSAAEAIQIAKLMQPANGGGGGMADLIKGLQALDELRGDGGSSGGGVERSGGGEWSWIGPVLAEVIKANAGQPPRRHVPNTARAQAPGPGQPTQPSTQAAAGFRAPGRSSPPRTAAAGVNAPPAAAKRSPEPPRPPLKLVTEPTPPEPDAGDVQVASPEQTLAAITKAIVGTLMLSGGQVNAEALADELLATLHDDSLAAMLEALEPGALVTNVEALIPPALKPGITDETRAAVAELERLLRQDDDQDADTNEADAGDDTGEPAA